LCLAYQRCLVIDRGDPSLFDKKQGNSLLFLLGEVIHVHAINFTVPGLIEDVVVVDVRKLMASMITHLSPKNMVRQTMQLVGWITIVSAPILKTSTHDELVISR
jgi:hypothetical protein